MVVGEDATPQGADGFSNFKQTIKKIVDSYPLNECELLLSKDDTVRICFTISKLLDFNFRVTSFRIHFIFLNLFRSVSPFPLSQASSSASQSDSQVSTLDFLCHNLYRQANPTRWFRNRSPLVSQSRVSGIRIG